MSVTSSGRCLTTLSTASLEFPTVSEVFRTTCWTASARCLTLKGYVDVVGLLYSHFIVLFFIFNMFTVFLVVIFVCHSRMFTALLLSFLGFGSLNYQCHFYAFSIKSLNCSVPHICCLEFLEFALWAGVTFPCCLMLFQVGSDK